MLMNKFYKSQSNRMRMQISVITSQADLGQPARGESNYRRERFR
jgi:hypothetical protein